MKKIFTAAVLLLASCISSSIVWAQSYSQPPDVVRSYIVGGTNLDIANRAVTMPDGGIISVGRTLSNDGNFTAFVDSTSNSHAYVVKHNALGSIEWGPIPITHPASLFEFASDIVLNPDGTVTVVGTSHTTLGTRMFLVRITSQGNQTLIHSSAGEFGIKQVLKRASNGDYVIGTTETLLNRDGDYALLRISAAGVKLLHRNYGGTAYDEVSSVELLSDGGYALNGVSYSTNYDVDNIGTHTTGILPDIFALVVSSNGTIRSRACFGGVSSERAGAIKEINGKLVITGSVIIDTGTVFPTNPNEPSSWYDGWIIVTDLNLTKVAQLLIRGNNSDHIGTLIEIPGGYLFGGATSSSNAPNYHGKEDLWLGKVDANLNLVWQKCFGGSRGENFSSMSVDGSRCIIAGYTLSNDGDLNGPPRGTADALVLKLEDSTPKIMFSGKVFLRGAYDSSSQMMRPTLNVRKMLPNSQPYTMSPFNYAGTERVDSAFFATHPNIVDWVLVRIRKSALNIAAQKAVFVMRDGTLMDIEGNTLIRFDNVNPEAYYVTIQHRNHLGIRSTVMLDFSSGAVNYDFTTAANQSYQNQLYTSTVQIGTIWAMRAGNAYPDNVVKYTGPRNDQNQILNIKLQGSLLTIFNGYATEDLNMDGDVKVNGPGNDQNFFLNVILIGSLSAIFIEQMFDDNNSWVTHSNIVTLNSKTKPLPIYNDGSTVTVTDLKGDEQIHIYSMSTGQLVKVDKVTGPQYKLQIGNYVSGAYVIKVYNKGTMKTLKFIK